MSGAIIYDFLSKLGVFCKDIMIPFLATCTLFRIYIYFGWKNKAYARGVTFFDKFIENLAKEFKDTNVADIINFNKSKREEG